jgi:hypothetical protein
VTYDILSTRDENNKLIKECLRMTMNILSKFNEIKIENVSRIDEEDRKYCEMQEQAYNETMDLYKDILSKLINLYNNQMTTMYWTDGKKLDNYDLYVSDYTNDFGVGKVFEEILKLKGKFIGRICYHFEKKYKITINRDVICEKYKDIELNYHKRKNSDGTYNEHLIEYKELDYKMIIDQIFVQLEGHSFDEKAVDEIKNKLQNLLRHKIKNNEIKVSKNKISIPNFFYLDSFDVKWGHYRVNFSERGKFDILLTAISHYEQGATHNTYLNTVMRVVQNEEGESVFCEHGLMCFKAESIKLYKNGKVDIKFISSECAKEFLKVYCNYIPVA